MSDLRRADRQPTRVKQDGIAIASRSQAGSQLGNDHCTCLYIRDVTSRQIHVFSYYPVTIKDFASVALYIYIYIYTQHIYIYIYICHIYIYMYTYTYIWICKYIYIYRERERGRERETDFKHLL